MPADALDKKAEKMEQAEEPLVQAQPLPKVVDKEAEKAQMAKFEAKV